MENLFDLEEIWDGLLSRQPTRVCETYNRLDAASQQVVLEHLRRMAGEPGWHPLQAASASAALQALQGTEAL